MNDIVGYIIVNKDAKIVSNTPESSFKYKPIRVLEFAIDGGALIVNNECTGLAMIEPEDIIAQFKCSQQGIVICPPNLNSIDQMFYVNKAMTRKGGYNWIVGQMVIAASLHKNQFNDSLLWAKQ